MLTDTTLAGVLSFTRASGATDFGADGNLAELAADAIRQGYDPATLLPAGWLLEGASTNGNRNARAEGGTVGTLGSGGVLPTNWNLVGSSGLACDFLGVVPVQGMPAARVRFYGTATGSINFDFDTSTGIVAAPGQVWQATTWMRQVAAPAPPVSYRIRCNGRTSGGSGVAGNLFSTTIAVDGTNTRKTAPFTLTADGTLARINFGLQIQLTVSNAYDFTLDIACPMMEQALVASQTPVLPTAGTPAASSRAADSLRLTGASFAQLFGSAAAGVVIADVLLPQNAATGLDQVIAQLDDGTDSNRLVIRNLGGGATITADAYVAGVSAGGSAAAGSMTAGTTFRCGLRWGAGVVALCLNGGAIQTLTTTLPSALGTLRLGNRQDGLRPLGGRLREVWGADFAPTDAKFIAACTLGADIDAAIRS